jgi:carbamoyltransferase
VWVQPAAGDAGGALGAALAAWHLHFNKPRVADDVHDGQHGSLLGPEFSDGEIRSTLQTAGLAFRELGEAELADTVADLIASGNVVGWFQGRMEFGPRALGARSILGDARSATMQETMNLKIKFRESFRPFAPAVLEERAAELFDLRGTSPYMLVVAPVRGAQPAPAAAAGSDTVLDRLRAARSPLPAVTHVDGSARVQTVGADAHPRFRALLESMARRRNCPAVVNTSFNVRGEPMVCTPEDAIRCFQLTNMDWLAIGNCLVKKERQLPLEQTRDWLSRFELD